jgi:ribosomal protein S6
MKEKTKLYEITYLINPSFTKQGVSNKINYYLNLLIKKGSKAIIRKNEKRALNYPIKKFESANYIEMVYSGNGKLVTLLNKEIKRDEDVIRNITIKLF